MAGKKVTCDLGGKAINLANYACSKTGGSAPKAARAVVMVAAGGPGGTSGPCPPPAAPPPPPAPPACPPAVPPAAPPGRGGPKQPCHPCLPRPPDSLCKPEQAVSGAPRPYPCPPGPPGPPARAVNVCATRDVRPVPAPPRSPCPEQEGPLSALRRVLHFAGLSLRAALVLGLVAYTNAQGLWDGQEASARLYGRSVLRLAQAADLRLDVAPGQLPEVPVMHDLAAAMGSLWNRGVSKLFDGVMFVPRTLGSLLPPDEFDSHGQRPSSDKDRGE